MLAELEMEDEHLSQAESLIRHTGLLFTNNFADKQLKTRNHLLLALLFLRKDPTSEEALDLIVKNHEQVSMPADSDERLRLAMSTISNLMKERADKHSTRATIDSALQLPDTEFFSHQDVLVAEVIASMEKTLEDRTQKILDNRKTRRR